MTDSDVVIYGSSDDLIEVEGTVPGCGEYNCERAAFVLVGADGAQAIVLVRYGDAGCWGIEVAPVADDIPMLACGIEPTITGYSARAVFRGVTNVVKADV